MKCFYVPSMFVTIKDAYVVAIGESDQPQARVIANSSWLTILEIFLHEHALESAYQRFQRLHGVPMAAPVWQLCAAVTSDTDSVLVRIADTSLQVLHRGADLDCSALSKEHAQVLGALFSQAKLAQDTHVICSRKAFGHTVDMLATLGLLAPLPHTLNWGDLRRRAPLCPVFGFSRGTPIDRYYLHRFLGEVRSQVRGTVLEVGGILANRERYGFDQAVEFQTLDLTAKPGVTHIGDVHDATLLPPASFDTVVLLNVLEHCQQPWVVVNNIHRWLRAGGRCVCMVPSAQRVHNFPRDYWRLLPDGLQQLFEAFSQQQFHVYGNPLTVVANYLGVAAEELAPHELDERHPAYPVAICLVATK